MKNQNSLYMIKLGGSLITDKNKPYTIRRNVLKRILGEISSLKKEGYKILLGHGGGSFPHVSASRYKTAEGFISPKSKYGMAVVHYDAERLNMIIMKILLNLGVEAYPIQASSISIAENGVIKYMYVETILHLLRHDIMPVLYGDVGLDMKRGCTILSTEEIFRYLAINLTEKYRVKIVMCEAVDGVFDKDPNIYSDAKLIPKIDSSNIDLIYGYVADAHGIDVTGGMKHKVEKLYELTKYGVESIIINGRIKGKLVKAVKGLKVKGTLITK